MNVIPSFTKAQTITVYCMTLLEWMSLYDSASVSVVLLKNLYKNDGSIAVNSGEIVMFNCAKGPDGRHGKIEGISDVRELDSFSDSGMFLLSNDDAVKLIHTVLSKTIDQTLSAAILPENTAIVTAGNSGLDALSLIYRFEEGDEWYHYDVCRNYQSMVESDVNSYVIVNNIADIDEVCAAVCNCDVSHVRDALGNN